MSDISKRARELIAELSKNGFKEFAVPEAYVHASENPAAHYAVIEKLYVDAPDHEYFDHDQLDHDFQSMLVEWFTFPDEKTVFLKPNHTKARYEKVKQHDRVIVVAFQKSCDELEVYRLIKGRMPDAEDA
ncbi:MAG: hypothetical protein P4L67_04695 [Candidatus Pacebacteria bacterium]|nr:hypothetical protein [Candidatus Paceibacterota bacterium]